MHKDGEHEWAIVALDYRQKPGRKKNGPYHPALGIRWFGPNKAGMPAHVRGKMWFIIPSQLAHSILTGLPLDHDRREALELFLREKIAGDDLVQYWEARKKWR